MKKRIVAAWKVLRGEWVAHAPVKPSLIYEPTVTTASTTAKVQIHWTTL